MLVRLLTEWADADGNKHEKGVLLKVADEDGQHLIDEKIAEKHDGEETDYEPEGDEGTDADAGVTKEDVQSAVDGAFGKLEAKLDQLARTSAKPVDVRVGRINLVDDPTAGYGNEIDLGRVKTVGDVRLAMRGFGQFALDVYSVRGGVTEKLQKWDQACKAAGDGVSGAFGFEGGYLLPAQFLTLMERQMVEGAVVRPRATVLPATSKVVSFPVLDDTSHASNVHGGMLAYWKGEEAQLTSSRPTFSDEQLHLHKLTILCYVSGDMLTWSPISLETWLPNKMAETNMWKEDDGFIGGSGGAGEPIGLLNSACKIAVDKETGQSAATIQFENIVKMDSRLWAPDRSGVIWIANQDTKPQLSQMFLAAGVAGIPVFLPANGAEGRPLETLYGYPIVFTEKAKTLGTEGDIMLCNVREYVVADAAGKTRLVRNAGLKFDYDQEAFRLTTWSGGMVPWRSAFTPKNSTATLSPVVTLAVRE